MNSVFEKLTAAEKNNKNLSGELDILKSQILEAIEKICEKKEPADADSIYDFIVHASAFNINTKLIGMIIEEVITQNVIFN